MHTTEITVRGFDCDIYAHVNNARYLEYLEACRWDWVNATGATEYFARRKMSFVVVNINIDYRRAAVLNDVLLVSVRKDEVGNKSARVKQTVIRKSDDKLIAEATITFAMVDNTTGKTVEITEDMLPYFD
ncbi:MAG TPA: thioesterase family protein [Chitinophagales bacterium]|nr:thioesterase family protein [Chitinophagales bacterium]